ncbi:hypothetical protein FB45DRAFT_862401 [Roridomyces roridus]|uniref:F-box domain-containing protein n=1 Tax=Roridomyces roridus TaxID=1738132 RepID=A0AAD7FV82_9AGAR|nr:hypothetical protein FB45DRAFT_862401 [Roridomyces roridus]
MFQFGPDSTDTIPKLASSDSRVLPCSDITDQAHDLPAPSFRLVMTPAEASIVINDSTVRLFPIAANSLVTIGLNQSSTTCVFILQAYHRVERDESQQRLDAYRYPVLTLPNEIVSEIFVHTLPLYPACPPLMGPASPIPLAHICRKWREIAVSTPGLWRSICATAYGQVISRKQTEVVRTWLDRSGSCPLSIQIETAEDNHPVLQEIHLHRERWEHILEVISAPALQELRISAEDLGDKPVGTLGPLISRSGFKLQKLLITGDRRRWPQVSKRVFRSAFPTIPEIAFNSKFILMRGRKDTRRIRVIPILTKKTQILRLLTDGIGFSLSAFAPDVQDIQLDFGGRTKQASRGIQSQYATTFPGPWCEQF